MMYTVKELQKILGDSVKTIRLNKDIDQTSLCDMSGISINALKNLESGRGTSVKTLISVLIILGKQDWLKALAPDISINPLRMVRGKPRRRVTRNDKKIKTNLDHRKNSLKKYGLTVDLYVRMHSLQNGKCGNSGCDKILDLKSSKTHVDHNHVTGKVRSLLCSECNFALGLLKESVGRASGLIEYIKKHNV